MKKAVIITENQYPCEDAGAIRQHATAKLLQSCGYSVLALGYGQSTNKQVLQYDGIDYISFRPKSKNKFIRGFYRATAPARMMRFMEKNCKDASLILIADASEKIFNPVKKKYKNSILIHDSVEWFSAMQFAEGENARGYIARDNINRNLVSGRWRVMAISSHLEQHFSKQCDKVVRIPVIMDIESVKCNLETGANGDKIRFAYVGSPGKKDYLKNIIDGFELLSKELLDKVELHIVGVNENQLVSVCGIESSSIKNLKNVLFAHGRLPHDDAISFVRNADYTVLLRDASLRYAKAGFPTKSVESLACGTPMICNLSSDLGLYLQDGYNAFIAEDHQPSSLKSALEKAINISFEQRKNMRINARKTAEEAFDYRRYVGVFEELVK